MSEMRDYGVKRDPRVNPSTSDQYTFSLSLFIFKFFVFFLCFITLSNYSPSCTFFLIRLLLPFGSTLREIDCGSKNLRNE